MKIIIGLSVSVRIVISVSIKFTFIPNSKAKDAFRLTFSFFEIFGFDQDHTICSRRTIWFMSVNFNTFTSTFEYNFVS